MLKKTLFMLYTILLAGGLPLAQAATNCAAVSEIPSTECEVLVTLDNNFIDKRDNSTNGVSSATSVYKGGINPLSLRLMRA